jgi:hypothetical protein
MPASVRKLSENHKIDYDHEHIIECPTAGRLVWDDKEGDGANLRYRLASRFSFLIDDWTGLQGSNRLAKPPRESFVIQLQ